MIDTTDSNEGIVNFVLTAVQRAFDNLNTSNMATITAISDDKSMLNVVMDTTKEEMDDIPFITISGGVNHLQFPITIGDKCLIIFSKDSVEDWLSGNTDLSFSSDFSINNGFALVGINDSTNPITINDYVDFKVPSKIKISNDTDDMVSLLSDAIAEISSILTQLTGPSVTGVALGGPLSPTVVATLTVSKAAIDALKIKFDNFKV